MSVKGPDGEEVRDAAALSKRYTVAQLKAALRDRGVEPKGASLRLKKQLAQRLFEVLGAAADEEEEEDAEDGAAAPQEDEAMAGAGEERAHAECPCVAHQAGNEMAFAAVGRRLQEEQTRRQAVETALEEMRASMAAMRAQMGEMASRILRAEREAADARAAASRAHATADAPLGLPAAASAAAVTGGKPLEPLFKLRGNRPRAAVASASKKAAAAAAAADAGVPSKAAAGPRPFLLGGNPFSPLTRRVNAEERRQRMLEGQAGGDDEGDEFAAVRKRPPQASLDELRGADPDASVDLSAAAENGQHGELGGDDEQCTAVKRRRSVGVFTSPIVERKKRRKTKPASGKKRRQSLVWTINVNE